MEKLKDVDGLVVQQKKEWGEILTGFETRNRYAVSDARGAQLYLAAEESGNFLIRQFLKSLRPFTVRVVTPDGQDVLCLQRPFRFYFHRLDVFDASGQLLGSVEKRFSLLRRIYSVQDAAGNERFQLFGPILHPWTFEIRCQEEPIGKITKKWSGLAKEAFTDADNFGVTFPADLPVELKGVFLGAVFLVDFVHFEKTN